MTDMFAPGATLRAAREKHKLTLTQIAEATRIKRPIIEAIENNDFSGIAAPLYGKGFIRLYAEAVGLDPEPLVREYLERHAREVRPSLKSERPPSAPAVSRERSASWIGSFRSAGMAAWTGAAAQIASAMHEVVEALCATWDHWRSSPPAASVATRRYTRGYTRASAVPVWRYAAIGVAVVLVAVLLMAGARMMSGWWHDSRAVSVPAVAKPGVAPKPLRLQEEPAPSYLRIPPP